MEQSPPSNVYAAERFEEGLKDRFAFILKVDRNGRRTLGRVPSSNLIENAAASVHDVAMSKKRLKCICAKVRPVEKYKNHIGVV
jgi:hypothetical protein